MITLYWTIHQMIVLYRNIQPELLQKINEFGADGRLTVEERDELIALYEAEKEKEYGSREN